MPRNRNSRTTRTTATKTPQTAATAVAASDVTESTPETETAATAVPATPESTTEETAKGFDPSASFDDDSRVTDPESFGEVMATVSTAGMTAYRADVNAAKTKSKLAAAIVALRVRVLRKDGRPDFEGETAAAKDATSDAMSEVREKLGKVPYRTFMNAVRKAYPAALLPEIVLHVIATQDGFPAERVFVFGEHNPATGEHDAEHPANDEAAVRKQTELLIAGPTAMLIAAVRKVYAAADLAVPRRYAGKECRFWLADDAPETGGPGKKDAPASAVETVAAGVAGMADVTPLYSAAAILQSVSLVAAKLTHPKTGAIDDRPAVAELWDRATTIGNLTAKFLHDPAKFSDQDRAALVAASWSQKDADAISTP